MGIRKIARVWKSKPAIEGAGVQLKRAFGFQEVPGLDPFLLLDDFRGDRPEQYIAGFPWHPHRGIETITYMLEGHCEHGDSMGNKGIISAGDVQWMTAGSGIIHQEMPKGTRSGRMGGFQLWANLPRSQKMMDPRYRDVQAGTIPEVAVDRRAVIKVIAGEVNGVEGPVRDIVIDPEYLDITVNPDTEFSLAVKDGYTSFVYVVEGRGYFDRERDPYAHEVSGQNWFDTNRECRFGSGNLVLFEKKGDGISITTEADSVRFILVSGKPLNEPVAWYGPIVMNTQDELRVAFDEYRKGTFIKYKGR